MKRWNQWALGGLGVIDSRCVGKGMGSTFVRCCETVSYENRLVSLRSEVHEQS